MRNLHKAVTATFQDGLYKIIAVSFAANFLALDYILLSQSTTLRLMVSQNTAFFNGAQVWLSLLTAVLFGLSAAMLLYIFRQRREGISEAAPGTVFGTATAAIASGCPVCGAWLLALLGIASTLAAFPLQGLELKLLAVALLLFSLSQSANAILGLRRPGRGVRKFAANFAVISVAVAALFLLPYVPEKYKLKFQQDGVIAPTQEQIALNRRLQLVPGQVTPAAGFEIDVTFGNIGYRLVQDGVIDFPKFAALYERAGSPLTPAQRKIFAAEGLEQPITITRENAYFLLNLFWAFGLANENPILTEGQMAQYGRDRIGGFASTGGWTISTRPLEAFFAKSDYAPLTEAQQARLQRVAENVYRPCCGNSTAFPDCNHGMALLGVLELLAANGASEDEMFEAAKYFSAFWFPDQANEVARFFMLAEGKDFADIDPRQFVGEAVFSNRGASRISGWLRENISESRPVAPQQGSGCGV